MRRWNSSSRFQASQGASYRKNEFPTMSETDLPVFSYECGGPVVDLAGRVVGITIARVDVPAVLVLPGDSIRKLLPGLKSGKLAGNWVPPKDGLRREVESSRRDTTVVTPKKKSL